jgi:hypothetical protein
MMKNRIKTIFLLLSLLELSTIICPGQSKPRVSAIQARIFYNGTGTFSENAIDGNVDLWNSNFDNSYSTMVLVKLDGLPPYAPDKSVRVELTARYIPFYRERGSITVRQVDLIRNGTEDGISYAAFWLKNTGCNWVYLKARIVGRKQPYLKETIRFGCGE